MIRTSQALVLRRGTSRRRSSRQGLLSRPSPRAMVTQLAILLSACLALGLVFVFLWQSWQMVSLSAQLSRSLAELRAIQNEMEWLELRVSEAFSEAYVSRFAEERLGMIQVLPEILFLSPDSK